MQTSHNDGVRLCVIACMYNERLKGNLERFMMNVWLYADHVLLYDDGSVDDSVSFAEGKGAVVIRGRKNDFCRETEHLQGLINHGQVLFHPTHFLKMDVDEVFCREASTGSLRTLAKREGNASFPEVTLWRSTTWARKDYLGNGRFVRLWRNTGSLQIPQIYGLHKQLFPANIGGRVFESDLPVLHYGYASKEAIVQRWNERTKLGVPFSIRWKCLDEKNMVVERVSDTLFPENIKYDYEEELPMPIMYEVDENGFVKV